MNLPTTRTQAIRQDPWLLTLFGPTKVGKTTLISMLENCLVIDTESGSDFLSGLFVKANNVRELGEIVKSIKESSHKYDYLAVDTIDRVVDMMEDYVIKRYNYENKKNINTIADIPYGGGYALLRTAVMDFITELKKISKRVILVGHRKKTIIGDTSVELTVASMDLPGKIKNLVSADSDAIGMIYRDGDKLMISFKASEETEVGSRCAHLTGQIFEFDWKRIYIDK